MNTALAYTIVSLTAMPALSGAPSCLAPSGTQTADAAKPNILYFILYKDTAVAGTAQYAFTSAKDGTKDLKITMTFSQGVTVSLDAKYDKDNVWTAKTLDATAGTRSVHLEAHRTDGGAQVQMQGPNGPVMRILEPPPGLSIADPTLSWWKGVIPEKGRAYSFAYFDLEKNAWVKETATYTQDVVKTLSGTDFKTHEIVETMGTAAGSKQYIDDSGNPVVIEGTPRFERTAPPSSAPAGS